MPGGGGNSPAVNLGNILTRYSSRKLGVLCLCDKIPCSFPVLLAERFVTVVAE